METANVAEKIQFTCSRKIALGAFDWSNLQMNSLNMFCQITFMGLHSRRPMLSSPIRIEVLSNMSIMKWLSLLLGIAQI